MKAEFLTTLNYSTIETSGFSIWPNTRIMKTHLSMGLEIDGGGDIKIIDIPHQEDLYMAATAARGKDLRVKVTIEFLEDEK